MEQVAPHGRRSSVMVTFRLPKWIGARHAELVAEFASWAPMAMDRRADGSFFVEVGIDPGQWWRYYFVIDDGVIVADPEAERYLAGDDGAIVSALCV
jgi:hypothetical protein